MFLCHHRRVKAVSSWSNFPLVHCFLVFWWLLQGTSFGLRKGNGSSYNFSCRLLLQKEGSSNVSDGGQTGQSTASLPKTADISDGGIDRHSSAIVPFTTTDEQQWRYQGFINSESSFSERPFCSIATKCLMLNCISTQTCRNYISYGWTARF